MEEQLRAVWRAALGTDVSPAASERAFEQLLGHYREPHRHYHTVKHLAFVLSTADELLAAVSCRDPAAVRLALFFHDVVYDPGSNANEVASAAVARRVLGDLGVPAARLDAVAALIEATANHERGNDLDRAVVNDADLAILAADPAVYDAYVNGVRSEYAHVDDTAWRQGRTAVLRQLLERSDIFATAPMQRHEARARANLTAELVSMER